MSASSDARKYLELVCTAPAERIGPHRLFRNPAVDVTQIRELAARVTGAVNRIDERTYTAPSAWHAAAWLLDLTALVGQMAEVDQDTNFHSPFAAERGAPVFRGQRDPRWKLSPTLLREPRDPLDLVALELFIRAVSGIFEIAAEDSRMNGRNVHMAAAQHYGLKTPLLDFTADPRIAVFFACNGVQTDHDHHVVVYAIPFNLLADLGGAVVLPPLWVKRLYAQRGLFLDCSELPTDIDLRDFSYRLLFPPDKQYGRLAFQNEAETLLPTDPWYETATKWAHDTVRATDPSQWKEAPAEILRRECGAPPFLFDALVPAFTKEALDKFVDMCEWLALKAIDGTFTYDCGAIIRMWQHNEPLFRSQRVLWKLLSGQYPNVGRELARGRTAMETGIPQRWLAAMEAITACIEEDPAHPFDRSNQRPSET